MKRMLTALVVGVVIGYGVQCEDATGPIQSVAAPLPTGDRIVLFSNDTGVDNHGHVWRLDPGSRTWALTPIDSMPIPVDSVAHWGGLKFVVIAVDARTWVLSGTSWIYIGKPEFQ